MTERARHATPKPFSDLVTILQRSHNATLAFSSPVNEKKILHLCQWGLFGKGKHILILWVQLNSLTNSISIFQYSLFNYLGKVLG